MTVLLLARTGEQQLAHKKALEAAGFRVVWPEGKKEALRLISDRSFTVTVLCYSLSSETAQELAEVIKQTYPECPLITVSETGVEDTKLAADDRVALSDGAAALVRAVMKAASQVAAREEDVHLSRKSMAP